MPRQSTVIHRDTLLRSHFFGLQGTQWMQNSAKCTSTRGETSPRTPSRTTTWQCVMRHLWWHLFTSGQYGLSDHNAAKHRWFYFLTMQMDAVLLFKQFESDTTFPVRMTFHTAFVVPIARPDAPERVRSRWTVQCLPRRVKPLAFWHTRCGDDLLPLCRQETRSVFRCSCARR